MESAHSFCSERYFPGLGLFDPDSAGQYSFPMTPSYDDELARVLNTAYASDEHGRPRSAGAAALAAESILSAILGGSSSALGPSHTSFRRLDILVPREGRAPLGIEVKLLSSRSIRNSLTNRVSDLLAGAIEARRSFRGEISLAAFILVGSDGDHEHESLPVAQLQLSIQRLLRAADGVGYDSVVVGFAAPTMRWMLATAEQMGVVDARPSAVPVLRTDEMVTHLLNQDAQPVLAPTTKTRATPRRYLLVGDEWRSGHGGLSTLNRELAVALAAAGVDVAVMVPSADDEELAAASSFGISLVTPASIPGLTARESLLLPPVFSETGWEPDVVIGHGRVLGPLAAAQKDTYFPAARRVHFVHTDAEQLEAAKETPGGASSMERTAERRELERALAQSADLVVGVGPHLADMIRDELIGSTPPANVICLTPGLRTTYAALATDPPARNTVLLLGRADDFRSKGLDLAAESILRVVDAWPLDKPHIPKLVIRGVPDSAADDVKRQLDEILEERVTYVLRPFSQSEDQVLQDLREARVLLMPSRHEGFGLSAWEAIASGVPSLISAESGLAQLLRERHLDTFPSCILSTRNQPKRLAADIWAEAITQIMLNPVQSREAVSNLRKAVSTAVTWQNAAKELIDAVAAL